MNPVEFLAIGDPVIDEFIRLKEAQVHCDINREACTISMRWGDKIPFESATKVVGVGNAANAAVAARRLGLSSAVLGIVGDDDHGRAIETVHRTEGLAEGYLSRQEGVATNYHFVLWFESERTILVKHEAFRYEFPTNLPPPKTLYLSSLAETVDDAYYDALADYLEQHPGITFAFQPGTFQIKLGMEKLARLYKRAQLFFCNKEEAQRLLKTDTTMLKALLEGLRAAGPHAVIITDGRNGAYAYTGTEMVMIPMYPDNREPFERTGAGDAFASTVTVAQTLGLPLEEALLWGPINAMSVVQDIGAQKGLLARARLDEYLHTAPETYRVTPL